MRCHQYIQLDTNLSDTTSLPILEQLAFDKWPFLKQGSILMQNTPNPDQLFSGGEAVGKGDICTMESPTGAPKQGWVPATAH